MNNNLKNRREKTGLTQVQVAQKSNMPERSYQNYEYGKRVPDAYTAQLIARSLGSTVEALFPLPRATIISIEKQQEVRK